MEQQINPVKVMDTRKKVIRMVSIIAFLISLSVNGIFGSYYYYQAKQIIDQRKTINDMHEINYWQQEAIHKLNDDLSKANESLAAKNSESTTSVSTSTTASKKSSSTSSASPTQETVLTPPAPPSD